MATIDTVFTPEELLSKVDNAQTGAELIAAPTAFTGGTVQTDVLNAQAEQQALLTLTTEFSAREKWDAFRRNTNTHFISNVLLNNQVSSEFSEIDPTLNRGELARSLLEEYALPLSDENLSALGEAGTTQDMTAVAKRLKQHSFDMQVLQEHGAIAFATGMVDPATLVADIATFGATRALRMGRMASAVAGASANVGVLGAADAAGKEVDVWEYAATAALSGAAFGLFGGEVGRQIATGQRNWFGGKSTDRAGAIARFTSEADAVAPTPAARAHMKKMVDDPLRREDYFQSDNAASIHRRLNNISEGDKIAFDKMLDDELAASYGHSFLSRTTDLNGSYTRDRDALQVEVYAEIARRDAEFNNFGYATDNPNLAPNIRKLVAQQEATMNRSGKTSQEANLPGFEAFTPRPGYVHRVAMPDKIRAFQTDARFGKKAVTGVVRQAIMGGIKGIDEADAGAIARAWIDRAIAKEAGMNTDFMGMLGRIDTDSLIDLISKSSMKEADKVAITSRLESKLGEKGVVKYARKRIPMDLTAQYRAADGSVLRMIDLLDTNLSRINGNYLSAMNGRAALAKAGIGRDDAEIGSFRNEFTKTIADLPKAQYDEAIQQFDAMLGDFTGAIPDRNILGPNAARAAALANTTMLAAQGVWQAAEYATVAARFGVFETAKHMFKALPGFRQTLQGMTPDMADELKHLMNVDLTRDIRFRPFNAQHDTFVAANNSAIDRVLHMGKQAMPFITAMKYVHSHQVRVVSNLAISTTAKAMRGDTEALAVLKSYSKDLDWDGIIARNGGKVTYVDNTGPVRSMNWDTWKRTDADAVVDTVLRYVDDTILFGRTGQGAAFSRTAVGQVLGQFRSFVSLANNKLMRGTLHNQGPMAYAILLSYQYPATLLMVTANEARKGALGDLSDEDYQKELAKKAIGYTAGLGFAGDLAGILGVTGRGGLSAPLLAAASAPAHIVGGVAKQFNDDPKDDDETLPGVVKGSAALIPVLGAIPGTTYAINAMKED